MRRPFPYPTKHDLATTAVSGAVGVAAGVALASRKKHQDPKPETLPDDPAWHAALAGKHPPKLQ